MSKSFVLSTLVVCATLISFHPAFATKAKGVERSLGNGTINWSEGYATVTGSGVIPEGKGLAQGRLMARRAAIADGYRQLAELINGVQITSSTTVKNFVASDEIRLHVDALIKGAMVEAIRPIEGAVEVDLKAPLYGQKSLASALNLGAFVQEKGESLSDRAPFRLAFTPGFQTDVTGWFQVAANDAYTGLIIDASGLGVEPAMAPFVVGGAKRVYPGTVKVDPDRVVKEGLTHYVMDIDEAKLDIRRIGVTPLVVEAKGATGKPVATDILLDEPTIQTILNANQQPKFLDALHVTIVI